MKWLLQCHKKIHWICVGSKGYMFNTHDMIDMEKLLENNSILELEGVADDSDKAFVLIRRSV